MVLAFLGALLRCRVGNSIADLIALRANKELQQKEVSAADLPANALTR